MKKFSVILIMLLANATLLFGQTEKSAKVDHYAGKSSIDDGFGGTWNVENITYVTGTGADRKEHSVYVLRRPSNMAAELPDTSACKKSVVKYPTNIRPTNVLGGDAIQFYNEDIIIYKRPESELLVYWWVGRDTGKIEEIVFWVPAKLGYASIWPKAYSMYEKNIKESLSYTTKETEKRDKSILDMLYKEDPSAKNKTN